MESVSKERPQVISPNILNYKTLIFMIANEPAERRREAGEAAI